MAMRNFLTISILLLSFRFGYGQTSAPSPRHVSLNNFWVSSQPEAYDIVSGRDGSIAMISGFQYSNPNLVNFFDRNLNFLWEIYFSAYSVYALAIESDSAIWISGNYAGGSLEKRDQSGSALLQRSVSGGIISHMLTDSANHLFAFNPAGLMKFDAQGNLIWAKAYGSIVALTRMFYNPDHTLSLVSADKVLVLDLDGNVLLSRSVTGGAVLIYPDRSFAVVKPSTFQVERLDSAGNSLWSVGLSGFGSGTIPGSGRAVAALNTGGVMVTYDRSSTLAQPVNCGGTYSFNNYGFFYLDRNGTERSGSLMHGTNDKVFVKRLKEDVNGDILLSVSRYYLQFGAFCINTFPELGGGSRFVFEGSCPQYPPSHQVFPVPAFASVQAWPVVVSSYTPTINPFNYAYQPYLSGQNLSGCCSKPKPRFTSTNTGNAFQFTSTVFYQDSLWWDFGDGNTDTVPNPSHVFTAAADSFLTCLYARNSCGIDSVCVWIKPCNLVQFSSTATETCLGDSLALLNTSDSGNVFSWYDNGNLFSTDTQAVWQAISPGTHLILLVGDNGFCQSRDSIFLQVFAQPPTAGFSFTNSNLSLAFTDSSIYATNWLWDFGDGNTSILQSPTHTYVGSGIYTICQIASNPCGADTFCSVFTCNVADADFSIYQFLDSISLTDQSLNAQSWLWDFGDGNTDTVQNPSHVYAQTGIYTVKLMVSNLCGTDSLTKSINVFVPNSGANTTFTQTFDFDTNSTRVAAIAETPDQGVVLVGHTGNAIRPFICKLDGFGNVLWAREIGGNPVPNNGMDVVVTTDQNYLVTGHINGGLENIFLMKISPQGNPIWTKTYGGAGIEYPQSIMNIDSNDVIVSGYIGNLGQKSFCMRVDSAGNQIWAKVIDKGTDMIACKKMMIDQDSTIVLALEVTGPAPAIYLMKLDPANGNEILTIRVGMSVSLDGFGGMTLLPNGEIVVCLLDDNVAYQGGNLPNGYISPFFYRFQFPDSIPLQSGVLVPGRSYPVWKQNLGYPDPHFFPYRVQELATSLTGDILAIGTIGNALNNNFAGFYGAGEEMMMLKLNPNLTRAWDKEFFAFDDNTGVDVFCTTTGQFLAAGNTSWYPPGNAFSQERINLYKIKDDAGVACNHQPGNPFISLTYNNILSNAAIFPPAFAFASGFSDSTVGFSLTAIAANDTTTCATVCNTFPTADYTYSISGYDATFSDSSLLANSYLWDFGDGSTSTLANPVHTYIPGTYQVCLVVANACGINSFCQSITITQLISNSNFSFSTNQNSASFFNSSVNSTNWAWNFGDGNYSSLENPIHTYDSCGTFNVCLIASNAYNSDTFCTQLTISLPAPVSNFAFQDSLYQVTFSDSSQNALSWHWDFGDGDTSSTQNPVHVYPSNGVYLACLITENFCGDLDTACQSITVNCPFPVADFSESSSQLTATFSDSSLGATSWFWDFGDGNTSSMQNPSHVYSTCGTYNVCLIVTNGCGQDTICTTLDFPFPQPVITQLGGTLYSSPAQGFQWYLNGVPSNGDTVQSIIPGVAGYFQVEVTDSNGCVGISDSVFVNPVGISSGMIDSDFDLFPNPTSGIIVVAFSKAQTGEFEVYSNLGVMLRSWDFGIQARERFTLSLGELSVGTYYVRVKFEGVWKVKKVEILR